MRKVLLVLAAVLLVGVAPVPNSASGARHRVNDPLAPIWGTRITVGEFLQYLKGIGVPVVIRPEMVPALDWPVRWDAATTEARPVSEPESVLESDPENSEVTPEFVIVVSHTRAISDQGNRRVYFGASSTVVLPPFYRLPYMSVDAVLFEDGWPIGYTGNDNNNVWRVTTNDTETVAGGGRAYWATTYHYVVYPPDYWPPYDFVIGSTRVIVVD